MKIKVGAGRLTMGDISSYVAGTLIGSADAEFEYICTDSREAGEDTLFVAFRGERVDGHDYISSAYDMGCRCFLAEKSDRLPCGASALIVQDSTKALIDISARYKSRVDCIRVGITGSVGKTTTKEFVAAVAAQCGRTHKTFGNYNSTIGMPLTLMETPMRTRISVLEMAMSGLGEISMMSRAACPDIAIITNIGSSHMEMLGSRENIRRAKLEIIDGLAPDGYLIINGDDDMLANVQYPVERVIRVGITDNTADYFAFNIKTEGNYTIFDIKCRDRVISNIKIPVIGEHNVYAALIAAAVGGIIGVDEAGLREGLGSYISVGLRQNILHIGNMTVIEDCYNASPESMRAAINVLCTLGQSGGRTLALLGDMKELGKDSERFHREVGKLIAERGVDMLFTIGDLARHVAAGALENGMSEECVFVNVDENTYPATAWEIMKVSKPGDVLLVKASRAIKAERVIECLRTLCNTEKN